MDLISICIPCYEMGGYGVKYLNNLLYSIQQQDTPAYEIVISDHSVNDDIQNAVKKWNLPIKYIRNTVDRGSSSSNINNAINNATGDIIKIMFQDDFFYVTDALSNIRTNHTGSIWCISACIHFNDKIRYHNLHTPYIQDRLIQGHNSLGSPSVLSFKKNVLERFDHNLIWFMDCEFYHRMTIRHGTPLIISSPLVAIRVGEHQVTNSIVTPEIVEKENQYIKSKYDI